MNAPFHATLVINGSYSTQKGEPDTPFRSEGVDLGPADYVGLHGAFVAAPGHAQLVDLKETTGAAHSSPPTMRSSPDPLLLDETGASRAKPFGTGS